MSGSSALPWVSVHIYCQSEVDRVLREVVRDVGMDLTNQGLVRDRFFLRYWEGGTHVRLRLRTAPGAAPQDVTAAVVSAAQRYLLRDPVPDVMPPQTYRELASSLARGTRAVVVEQDLRPNNSVAVVPYQPEHNRYGTGAALAACEQHFVDSSDLAMGVLSAQVPMGRRADLALSALVAAWLTAEPDPDRLVRWTSGMLSRWQREGALGRALDVTASEELLSRLGPDAGALVAAVRRDVARGEVTSASDDAGPAPSALVAWVRSVRRLLDMLSVEAWSGRYRPPAQAFGGLRPEGLGTGVSALLPVVDICAHLLCNRMGLLVPDEVRLRYVAARVCSRWSAAWAS